MGIYGITLSSGDANGFTRLPRTLRRYSGGDRDGSGSCLWAQAAAAAAYVGGAGGKLQIAVVVAVAVVGTRLRCWQ